MKNITPNKYRTASWRRGGFTLVELLLVLTILAILAGIVLPRISGLPDRSRGTAAKVQIANFVTALNTYEVDNGSFPRGANGLQALITKPGEANNWKGPYLQIDKLPLDPWKNAYVYENPGRHYPNGFDLYSNGKDGLGGTNIIANWTTE